jgi:hypothetical protein
MQWWWVCSDLFTGWTLVQGRVNHEEGTANVENHIETLTLAGKNYEPRHPRTSRAGFGAARSIRAGAAAARSPGAAAVDVGSLMSFVEGTNDKKRKENQDGSLEGPIADRAGHGNP